MEMKKLALITYDSTGYQATDPDDEDAVLLEFLKAKGLEAELAVWSDPEKDWTGYEAIILKSPWDYHERLEEFMSWLDHVGALGLRCLNPVEVVKWNLDKHYLKDIAAAGLPVLRSEFIAKGGRIELGDYFDQFNTDTLIVKPAVSGGSKNTFKIGREEAAAYSGKITELVNSEAYLVQPFVSQIQSEGEWSFLFFAGEYSHCVLKKTSQGDFRVQDKFGGTVHPQTAPLELLVQADKYVREFAGGCLYCRVDGVNIGGVFHLMELELIEPALFLSAEPESFERYYNALMSLN